MLVAFVLSQYTVLGGVGVWIGLAWALQLLPLRLIGDFTAWSVAFCRNEG